jgi:uncharacterized protein YbjT (DUF2867 family)
MADPEGKVALLAGASGLIGGHLLTALLEAPDFTRVYAVTRRPLGRDHPRLANRIVQFDKLEQQLKGLVCQVAFCCLGASRRDSQQEQMQRRIEFGHVLAFARAAAEAGAQRLVLVSCAGTDLLARRRTLRVKAETEQALEALGFASLDILQPGPLIGLRRELQLPELANALVALTLTPLLTGAREARRAIPARTVAAAMLGATRSGRRGVYRYTYAGIQALASLRPAARAAPPRTAKPGASRS